MEADTEAEPERGRAHARSAREAEPTRGAHERADKKVLRAQKKKCPRTVLNRGTGAHGSAVTNVVSISKTRIEFVEREGAPIGP